MDIKDLTGLGEPMKKLVEVVSSGLGKVYEPRAIKKNAEAKAIEIKIITDALSGSNLSLEKVSYEDGKLVIDTVNNNLDNSNISERSIKRLIYQEEKKQANIENIINNAANELKETKQVSGQSVDKDWISRFFSIAEDITSEEMQFIWGKLLSGEIKKPNSFSLRTLELIRNLSKEEAKLITKIASAVFIDGTKCFIVDDGDFLKSEFNFEYSDRLLLEELGIIVSGQVMNVHSPQNYFINGDLCICYNKKPDITKIPLYILLFTNVGKQILSVINNKANVKVIKNMALKIKPFSTDIFYGKVVERLGTEIKYQKYGDL